MESLNSPETHESLMLFDVFAEKDIEDYFNFADPILHVDWGEYGVPEEYTPDFIAAHPDFTKVFVVKGEHGDIIAGAKVKILDQETKERLGINHPPFLGEVGVLLEYTAIDEKYRNKRILADLTNKRLDWAREHGSKYACTELSIDNPISIWTKIRDGFKIVDIREPGAGIPESYFVAVKDISSRGDLIGGEGEEVIQVDVDNNSYEKLKNLFSDGWVGIDAKGPTSNEDEFDGGKWTIILGRK